MGIGQQSARVFVWRGVVQEKL